MPAKKNTWKKVGKISVDAGLCWVGDPYYILHRTGDYGQPPKSIGKTWGDFIRKLTELMRHGAARFKHDVANEGLGVCVETGYGDGVYDVEVLHDSNGRVAGVRVMFIGDEDT